MTAAFKLYLCLALLAAIGLYSAAPSLHVGNPVPGLMETLHAAEKAVGR
jgi:hypothetical protein